MVETENDLITVCYHYPSLDSMFGMIFLRYHFAKFPQYRMNMYQMNHRMPPEQLNLQYSHTTYFIGILPSDSLLKRSLSLSHHSVILLNNKTDDMRRLQSQMRSIPKLKFKYPASPDKSVFETCKDFFADRYEVPQNLVHLSQYVKEAETHRHSLPRSQEVAAGLYMV